MTGRSVASVNLNWVEGSDKLTYVWVPSTREATQREGSRRSGQSFVILRTKMWEETVKYPVKATEEITGWIRATLRKGCMSQQNRFPLIL